MKTIYTFLLCVVASSLFAQDTNSAPIINEPFDVKNKGFYLEIGYGYNTRSFLANVSLPSSTLGIYRPASYLAGSMVNAKFGYMFNKRIGVYGWFSACFPVKHNYENVFSSQFGSTKYSGFTQGWANYGAVGAEFFPFEKLDKTQPYIAADFICGAFHITQNVQTNTNPESRNIIRGGYGMGGALHVGVKQRLSKRLSGIAEINFTAITYKPKELYNPKTGESTPYTYDMTDMIDPNYGFIYASNYYLTDFIPMNFISFRVGLRYNFFGN